MSASLEVAREALNKAVTGQSFANYPAILEGFAARGIPEADIRPRENVFTYNAWRALGRQVRRGEKGVRVCTFREFDKKNDDGTVSRLRSPWVTTVFHISQTDAVQS